MSILEKIAGAVAGPLLGGLFGRSSEKRQNRYAIENTIASLPRLRESAEKAGFNPLTALLANGGGSFNAGAPSVAPLASTSVISGMVKDVSDIVTGEDERDKNRQQVQDDLEKLRLEKARSGGSQKIVVRTNQALPNVTNAPRLGGDRIQVMPKNTRSRPAGLTSAVNPQDVHVRENYTTSSGEIVSVPMGPDIDELIVGAGIDLYGSGKKIYRESDVSGIRERSAKQAAAHTIEKRKRQEPKPFGTGNTLPAGDWKHLTNSELTELATDYQKVKGTSKEASMLRFYRNKK